MFLFGIFLIISFFQWTTAQYIPIIDRAGNISNECANQMEAYFNGLQNNQAWAWNLFDASPKLPYGILTGNRVEHGNYDQCLRVNYDGDNEKILGKFCPNSIVLMLPTDFEKQKEQNIKNRISITDVTNIVDSAFKETRMPPISIEGLSVIILSMCIPDACSPSEITDYLEISSIGLPIMALDGTCETKDDLNSFTGADLAFVIFVGIIILSTIASTIYYEIMRHNRGQPNRLLSIFSVTSNFKEVIKTSNNPNRITCLDGLRVFSMLWVIMGHRFIFSGYLLYVNFDDINEWNNQMYTQYVQAATYAVDTFIFLTGLLMAMAMIKSQSKPGAKFNIFIFYIHRYIRLTPAMAMIYFVHVSIFNNLGSGPYWDVLSGAMENDCKDTWVSFFFYFQNYMEKKCIGHIWYLSLDMQIYILSPLVLLPLAKYRNIMMKFILPLLIIASIICPFVITCVYETPIFSEGFQTYYYFKTHTRISPWLVGVYAGALIYTYRDTKLSIDWFMNISLWAVVIVGMAACMFCGNDVQYNYNRLGTSFFVSLTKPAWSICLAWIVYACMKGRGGIVNFILSAQIFQTLSKLTYSMYLVHFSCIIYSILRFRYPGHFSEFDLLHQTMGDIFLTLIVGTLWYLLFESPIVALEKIVFGGFRRETDAGKKGNIDVSQIKIEPSARP